MKSMIETVTQDLLNHRGAYLRLGIYMFVSFFTELFSRFGTLTVDIVNTMQWWDWTMLYGQPFLTALIVWRTFIDSSLQDSKVALAQNTPAPIQVLDKPPEDGKTAQHDEQRI